MAKWDAAASTEFGKVKAAFSATDSQMQTLKQQIEAWANGNPNGRQQFPFGTLRNHGVTATTSGGWIKNIEYGDFTGNFWGPPIFSADRLRNPVWRDLNKALAGRPRGGSCRQSPCRRYV